MIVLDASAVLALLKDEPGADLVARHANGAVVGAANWSEVAQRIPGPVEWPVAAGILEALGIRVESVTREDAERAARLRASASHLSLGDRLCLALGERLDARVLTADRAWGAGPRIQQIRPSA